MHLRRTDDKRLAEHAAVDTQESRPLSSANHVGASIGISQESRNGHTGNERLHRLPTIVFVSKSLHEWQPSHVPRCSIFVEGERQAYAVPCLRMDGGVSIQSSITVVVAGVELESVDAVCGLHVAQDFDEIVCRLGVSEVVACGKAVPPRQYGGLSVAVVE